MINWYLLLCVFIFNTKYKLIPLNTEEKNNMKKLAIAGASLAFAALPVAGVFAEANSQSFTDNITVTVDSGCTMETSATSGTGSYADRTFTESVVAGQKIEFGNSNETGAEDATFTVSCNTTDSSKTWSVKATASTDGASENTKAALKHGTSDYIKGGTATSGNVSSWAMKMNNSSGTTSYTSYTEVPAAADTVVLSAGANVTGVTFRPSYQVYVAPNQAPGEYTGSVKYVVDLQ